MIGKEEACGSSGDEPHAWLAKRVSEIRAKRPIFIADFWNDGHLVRGCIAGGRSYLHINASGQVEPCAFVHFAVDNIHDRSLKDVLASPFFRLCQERQPFHSSHYAPCPIVDVPKDLREIVSLSSAEPMHPGADSVLTDEVATVIDGRSKAWRPSANCLETTGSEQ
ncbi:MAG: SPASM domain-containing protein [Bacillota bacterium]|nr:SPASM domain-containing protein [Bacillota bacterium]